MAAHLIDYDAERDAVRPLVDLELTIRLPGRSSLAEVVAPGRKVAESAVGYAVGRHQVRIDAGVNTSAVLHPEGEIDR